MKQQEEINRYYKLLPPFQNEDPNVIKNIINNCYFMEVNKYKKIIRNIKLNTLLK